MANGSALRAWEETPTMLAGRRKELAKVAVLLESPQRAKAKLRKRFQSTCDWETGELMAFQLRSGQYVIFRVVERWTDLGGTSPVVDVLDWCGRAIPDLSELRDVPIRGPRADHPVELGFTSSQFMIAEVSPRRIPQERIHRLHLRLPPTQSFDAFAGWLWRKIDHEWERWFGYP